MDPRATPRSGAPTDRPANDPALPRHEPLVVASRGGAIENVFYGSVAVVDAAGALQWAVGDADAPIFTRSALKPFQALPLVADGGVAALGLGARELAVIASSHSGEDIHVAAVDRVLERAGAAVSELRCGCHVPYVYETLERAPPADSRFDARHHNCSGKHAGFLAYCRLHGLDRDTYLDAEHPLQRRIRRDVAELASLADDAVAVGIDGCSAPNLALPLRALARLYARLAADDDAAPRAVFDAMAQHPEYVSGTGRGDLALSRAGGGDWVAKAGAAGVQAIAIRSQGLGIALKIADGSAVARDVATIAVLGRLGLLGEREAILATRARPPIRNVAGRTVGQYRPLASLTPDR